METKKLRSIGQWFTDINDYEVKHRLFKNTLSAKLQIHVDSMCSAIQVAFDSVHTPEGYDFWQGIYNHFLSGEGTKTFNDFKHLIKTKAIRKGIRAEALKQFGKVEGNQNTTKPTGRVITDWYAEIKDEEIRKRAMANFLVHKKDRKVSTLKAAIWLGMNWWGTPEGNQFWKKFHDNIIFKKRESTFDELKHLLNENLEKQSEEHAQITRNHYAKIFNSLAGKLETEPKPDSVNNPDHYGGKDNPYEAIKVIEAWGLGFNLGNTTKYISRAGKKDKDKHIEDLKKAAFYLNREIDNLEKVKDLKPETKIEISEGQKLQMQATICASLMAFRGFELMQKLLKENKTP